MALTANDQKFIETAQKYIKDYGLVADKRIGLIGNFNIGDNYFFTSVATSIQKTKNIKFVLFVQSGSPLEQMVDLQNANNADLEKSRVAEDLQSIFWKASPAARVPYAHIFNDLYMYHWVDPDIMHVSSSEAARKHHTRPLYDFQEAEQILSTYNIIPGKTIFVIPSSNWIHPLPDIFWHSAINNFKLLGYKIIINSRHPLEWGGEGVDYAFPPFKYLVPMANKCGIVFAMRSGISEAIAAETTAKIIIHGPLYDSTDILKWYPYIDNSDKHLVYNIVPHSKTFGSGYSDNFVQKLCSQGHSFEECLGPSLKPLAPKLSDAVSPAVISDTHKDHLGWFQGRHWLSAVDSPFCVVKYGLNIRKSFFVLHLFTDPPLNYEIHACLINSAKRKRVAELNYCQQNPIIFEAPESGTYEIFVKIYHPTTKSYCYFTTTPRAIQVDIGVRLRQCENFAEYMALLEAHISNLLVFVVSRDTPTDASGCKDLMLGRIGLGQGDGLKMRQCYIGVSDKGEAVFEQSTDGLFLAASWEIGGEKAFIASSAYNIATNATGESFFFFKGHNEMLNGRGLNFLVFDAGAHKLIDSMAVDTWLEDNPIMRYNKKYGMHAK